MLPLDAQTVVIWLVRAANQLLMLLPNTVTTPINNTAISATRSPYSVTAIPSSSRTKFRVKAVSRRIQNGVLWLDRGNLARTSGEPALDAATKDRDDTDQQHGDERDEQAILRHGDGFILLDEVLGERADAIHLSPLMVVVRLHQRWRARVDVPPMQHAATVVGD